MRQKPQVPPSFTVKKNNILASLSSPESTYTDLSPKGSVDAVIKSLIGRINALEGVVTTSSCAGRVSVFLEGRKPSKEQEERRDANNTTSKGSGKESEHAAVPGGKGMGGKWLFVSHEPVQLSERGVEKEVMVELLGLGPLGAHSQAQALSGEADQMRLVRFQFEPMVCRMFSFQRVFSEFTIAEETVDPPHHDRFSTPCPTHSRSSH